MASRAELEEEWRDFQLWRHSQTLEFNDYLEHRDLVIAKDNLETLKELIDGMDDSETITVAELKEVLRHA